MTNEQFLAVLDHVWRWLHPVTPEQDVHYVCQVAHQLRDLGWAPGAGLVAKNAGQEGANGQDGQRYALDAIWVALPDQSADIIIGAGAPDQRPGLIWYTAAQLPPVSTYRPPYGTRQVPLYGQPVPPTPTPDPDPGPDPEAPWQLVLAELAAIRDEVERLHARLDRRWPQELVVSLPSYLGGQKTCKGWVTPSP